MSVIRARALVYARSNGICEVCGCRRATNWHHRRNASQGGRWAASNGLHVCGSGTTGCHGWITTHPVLAAERGLTVRSTESPADVPVLHAAYGWVYLLDDGTVTC